MNKPERTIVGLVGLAMTWVLLILSPARAQEWKPVEGQLLTRWAKEVTAKQPLPEYPRPQLRRARWQNLNGVWEYAIQPKDAAKPENFESKILVPFPIESALSGVKKPVGNDNRLWYHRTFDKPELESGQKVLLHFGAVDWDCTVWVNGKEVGSHRGGYDPFTFDITQALSPDGPQEIVASVWDPTDSSYQPRGKQVNEPQGIWYTSVTGIWQTVWLETVSASHIQSLQMAPDVENAKVVVTPTIAEPADTMVSVKLIALSKGDDVASLTQEAVTGEAGSSISVPVPSPRLWSPDQPWLYHVEIVLTKDDQVVDAAQSYFGMRSIQVAKADDGFLRLALNGQPLFQFGPLDQGWWPDGLYTAPTDEALRYDIEVTKQLGFNMCRKHVKVEPSRWYYWCDKLGLMVWQDMPNGDRHISPTEPDITRSPESEANYNREWKSIIDANRNHPCIVAWVPFNEGWGQFKTDEILKWTKEYDPSRLVDGPSGWTDRGSGDMHDMHRYPGPDMPEPEPNRAVVLGEFGGLGLPMEEHLWWNKRNWGYRTYKSQEELQYQYEQLIRRLRPLIGAGLAAAIYTQTTDVEGEVNGLMTYDRAVVKLDPKRIEPLHRRLYLPPSKPTVLVPTSEEQPQVWKFTTADPGEGWMKAEFDDTSWKEGKGGFGTEGTPGAVIGTQWNTPDIWLRKTITVDPAKLHLLGLRVHHDEDVQVYLNGHRVAELIGYITAYQYVELDAKAREHLREGDNILAVHCHQTGGGQYIDVGLIDLKDE